MVSGWTGRWSRQRKQEAEIMDMLRKLTGFPGVVALCTAALVVLLPLQAQDTKPVASGIVATVDGKPITEDEVKKAAASELESLEMQRLQYEANYARERHQVLENNLD